MFMYLNKINEIENKNKNVIISHTFYSRKEIF